MRDVSLDLRWRHQGLLDLTGRSVLLLYGYTPNTPGRYLEDALRRAGVDVFRSDGDLTGLPIESINATIWVESPSKPYPVSSDNLPRPRVAWVHHGESRLAANAAYVTTLDPDLVLLAHSLHIGPAFGRRLGFFPFAWEPEVFRGTLPHSRRDFDVAFVGSGTSSAASYSNRRQSLRIAQRLTKPNRRSIRSGLYREDLAAVYGNARTVLNPVADRDKTINMRIWESIGCGALAITERVPWQDLLFEDGVHLREFTNHDELRDILRWSLASPAEVAQIADAATEVLNTWHRYEHRAMRLFEWIDDL